MAESRLFKPLKVGNMTLQHRIAMAPLTRFRADENGVPLPFVKEYYTQRASVPGTFLTSEATYIHPQHSGYPNAPGIYSEAQVQGWKEVTDAVHAKGSFIYLQLWALGRAAAFPGFGPTNATGPILSSSATRLDESYPLAHELTVEEIKETVQQYAQAAKNAIAAGFDGVEVHGANGYLVDQFTQDTANHRTDAYGGSIKNRSRFAVEVTEAVVKAVGAERTAIRLSPFSEFQGMRMEKRVEQFTDILDRLEPLGLSHVHLVEGRINGASDVERAGDSLDFAFKAFSGPIFLAGGFTPANAKTTVEEEYADRDVVVVFGRSFVSNPDLVARVRDNVELTKYDRATFYDATNPKGYVDYPVAHKAVSVVA